MKELNVNDFKRSFVAELRSNVKGCLKQYGLSNALDIVIFKGATHDSRIFNESGLMAYVRKNCQPYMIGENIFMFFKFFSLIYNYKAVDLFRTNIYLRRISIFKR